MPGGGYLAERGRAAPFTVAVIPRDTSPAACRGSVRGADLVLGMARKHRRAVVQLVPAASRYTFTLREFARLAAGAAEQDFPDQASCGTERRIVALRISRRWGPYRIGHHLHLPQSTVSKVFTRYRVPLLGHIDLNTGVRVRKVKPVRYERDNPDDLTQMDVKKLGRIPPQGGGHHTLGLAVGRNNRHL